MAAKVRGGSLQLAPTSAGTGKMIQKCIVLDRMNNHYNKLSKVKSSIDMSPPKTLSSSQKMRDRVQTRSSTEIAKKTKSSEQGWDMSTDYKDPIAAKPFIGGRFVSTDVKDALQSKSASRYGSGNPTVAPSSIINPAPQPKVTLSNSMPIPSKSSGRPKSSALRNHNREYEEVRTSSTLANKLYNVKSSIDASPPKSLSTSQKMRDRNLLKTYPGSLKTTGGGGGRPKSSALRNHNKEYEDVRMSNTYNRKVTRAKSAIDSSPPKSMTQSQKFRDSGRSIPASSAKTPRRQTRRPRSVASALPMEDGGGGYMDYEEALASFDLDDEQERLAHDIVKATLVDKQPELQLYTSMTDADNAFDDGDDDDIKNDQRHTMAAAAAAALLAPPPREECHERPHTAPGSEDVAEGTSSAVEGGGQGGGGSGGMELSLDLSGKGT